MSKRIEEIALKAYPVVIEEHTERDLNKPRRLSYIKGYEQAEKDLGWHSVKESLPPIDEEVIVLTDDINGRVVPDAHKICYGHRPNPDGWDVKNIVTGKAERYVPKTYDDWNIPGVTHWMYLPEIKEAE